MGKHPGWFAVSPLAAYRQTFHNEEHHTTFQHAEKARFPLVWAGFWGSADPASLPASEGVTLLLAAEIAADQGGRI